MKKYILIEIGCIECGVSTQIKGVYSSEKEAEEKQKTCKKWRNGGQSSPEIFEINI